MTKEFGKWLAEQRYEKRLTQGQVAQRAGVSTSYISTLERGQRHSVTNAEPRPTVEVVDAIAKALGVPQNEARLAAGYAAPTTEPQTIHELKQRLWDLGIHLEFGDDLDDGPEDLERAKASIAALMNAIFPPKKADDTTKKNGI